MKLSMATAVLAMAAQADENKVTNSDRAARGFRVGAQKDRIDDELLIMSGRFDLKHFLA